MLPFLSASRILAVSLLSNSMMTSVYLNFVGARRELRQWLNSESQRAGLALALIRT
ncbi:hypothetical protein BDR05DRAFT_960864 [Suillus weaverae]|nr:hypothetical protein BDR05DRAFT_960864 [Suillus weaverae]